MKASTTSGRDPYRFINRATEKTNAHCNHKYQHENLEYDKTILERANEMVSGEACTPVPDGQHAFRLLAV